MRLTKKERRIVFDKFGGKCAYCGCELPDKGWHADHIEPCLRKMEKATFSLELFRTEISKQVERAALYSVNFRTALRFGQIELNEIQVVFWFEKYNKMQEQSGGES